MSSSTTFTLQDLQRMKRADLQRLCKEYGVKANLKTESLIELLLDNVNSNNLPPLSPRKRAPSTAIRRYSARSRTVSQSVGARSRGASTRSIIVHDDPVESAPSEVPTRPQSRLSQLGNSNPPTPVALAPSKGRKAKEMQSRLGVGRPLAAGGSGARSVTRAGPSTRVSRAKSLRTVSKVIEEEPEEHVSDNEAEVVVRQTEPSKQSPLQQTLQPTAQQASQPSTESPAITPAMSESTSRETSAHQQSGTVERLQIEVEAMRSLLKSSVDTIAKLAAECQRLDSCVKHLSDEIPLLRAQVQSLQAVSSSSSTSTSRQNDGPSAQRDQATLLSPQVTTITGKFAEKSTLHRQPSNPLGASDLNRLPAPSMPVTTSTPIRPVESRKVSKPVVLVDPLSVALGKRQRDSTGSNITGLIDADSIQDLAPQDLLRTVIRHGKKRAKRDEEVPNAKQGSNSGPKSNEARGSSNSLEPTPLTPVAGLPPILNSPPPTAHLPEYFESSYTGPLGSPSIVAEESATEQTTQKEKPSNSLPSFPLLGPTTYLGIPGMNLGLELYSPGALAFQHTYEDPPMPMPDNVSTSSRPCTPPRLEDIHPFWGRNLVQGNEFTIPPDPSAFYFESPVPPRQPSPPPQFVDFTGIESLVPPSFPSWYETAEAQNLEPLSLRRVY